MLPTSLPPALRRQFSLSDIKSATNNFSGDLIIGKGSFGNVYKATIDTGSGNTTTVAVKRRSSDSKQGSKEFWTEVNLLSELRHTHLISLIGYCVDLDANEMILVYEYMANGTLADHIYKNNENSSRLNWEQRLKICIGVGRGVEYLHTGTGIDKVVIHRDLKSSNILLDADYAAKLSDFGLCKICSGDRSYNPIIASVKGTLGYMDPNYRNTRQLSTKTDVYAIGVVLLEVLCGRRSLDGDVVDKERRLVLWAQQCIREGVVHRIIDPGLWGRIADYGLSIFVDITLQCLQDRPDKRPTMVEVVAKLEAVLASQFTEYSSSVDDEFVKIYFGNVSCSSSSAYSDADKFRSTVSTSSGKSETVKQDLGSESNVGMKSKSSSNLPVDLQNNGLKAVYETSHDEYEKLVRRMNPTKVVIDNGYCENATIIKVDSSSTQGLLLDLLQVLIDFDLIITKASRTSDGPWFMDVFYVTDQEGYKITDNAKLQNIQEILHEYSSSTSPTGRNPEDKSTPPDHTTIELIGNDRPGLISEITAILTNLQCNVVTAEIWTHNTRLAAVMHLTDKQTKSTVIEPTKIAKLKKILLVVLKGGNDNMNAKITVSNGSNVSFDRTLHRMMIADRDYGKGLILNDEKLFLNDKDGLEVDVVNWNFKDYSLIAIRCKNTPKVLFDTICTLTELMYFVFHGSFDAEGPEVKMELWIRHIDGSAFKSDAERQRVIQYLEAAIERRVSKGLKIEILTKDRVGLLSDVTRIMRENSLNITRAEVATTGDKAVFSFYLGDNLGYPIDPKVINYVRNEIGQNILQVKGTRKDLYQIHNRSKSFTGIDFLKAYLGWIGFF